MKRSKKIISLFALSNLLLAPSVMAQPEVTPKKKAKVEKKSQMEKESDFVDFSSVRNLLKEDDLEKSAKQKQEKIKKVKTAREKRTLKRYDIPSNDEFWSFVSEYWLVKNAPLLKWDFRKPDYGLDESFAMFLEKLGIYNKNFKILLVDTPNVSHFALPSDKGEYIFILSLPFIRTLDLSKLEISLLLFENYLRAEMGHFSSKLKVKGLDKMLGANFYKQKFDKSKIDQIMKIYDDVIFIKGFSIQEQFEISKQLEGYLKSNIKLWNTYLKMLRKIDDLVKNNVLYTKYIKIYPSPELQIDWLSPKKKRI